MARARAALALTLWNSPAHLTMAPEAKRLEDAIRTARDMDPARRSAVLRAVDARLGTEPYEASDWDVLAWLRFAAGPAEPAAPRGALGDVVPAAGEESSSDARSLGVATLTIVANALLLVASVAPRLALVGRSPGWQGHRRAG